MQALVLLWSGKQGSKHANQTIAKRFKQRILSLYEEISQEKSRLEKEEEDEE